MDTTNFFHTQTVHIDKKIAEGSPKRMLAPNNQHSLETLLSIQDQNNEKLKITLRRLSIYENEIQDLKKKADELNHEKSNFGDQIFVLREKDKAAKLQIQSITEHCEILEVKNKLLLENIQAQSSEVNRLRRYQEKIKTQVKPYFLQLKDYSKNLEHQHTHLAEQLDQKELALQELRAQMNELIKNYQTQIDSDHLNISNITEAYEGEIHTLKNDIDELNRRLEFSEKESAQNKEYYNRFLDSENQKIELERLVERKSQEIADLAENFKSQETDLKRLNYKHETENKDLKITLSLLNKENEELTQKNLDIEQQLESMKFLWNQKNKETDKLKSALEALEKINLELSRQLKVSGLGLAGNGISF